MPLFDYVCRDCGREQEILIRGSETPECGDCGGTTLSRLLSAPIAHVAGQTSASAPASGKGPCGAHCGCHPH